MSTNGRQSVMHSQRFLPKDDKGFCHLRETDTVAEYQMEGGRTGGFTRLNESKAVPGGNAAVGILMPMGVSRGSFLSSQDPSARVWGRLSFPFSGMQKALFRKKAQCLQGRRGRELRRWRGPGASRGFV